MAAPSLTWKDLGILKDALAEFERTMTEVFMVNSYMVQES